ncbi:MAG: Na+/H+ antiporter NhaC family protein, partial [Eggerthellaceae bacterium]|nr:Na+/H+ antiporter NhaC family protein [Eggerthellaceae bacterium]
MEFFGTFWALVPPLVAIILALITKETYISLFVGIVVGGFLVAGFQPVAALDQIVNTGLVPAVADNAGIFVFLVILGIFVCLIGMSGAAAAFGNWAAKHIHSRVGSLIATFIFSLLIFIDDYFACLTVGNVMNPVTDKYRVSRAKLAYVIDATAAPIRMIAPVSSWAAAVSGTADDLGVNGLQLFVDAIPFNFYSLMTLVFLVGLVIMAFDYGPMAKAELEAIRNGELGTIGVSETRSVPRARIIDMVIPILVLIATCVLGMLYVGGFFGVDAWGDTAFEGDFIGAFGNTDAFIALPWGGLIALVITFIYLWLRRVVSFKESLTSIVKGFEGMLPAILILTFACSLKNLTGELGAAEFVAELMTGAAPALFMMLPAIIFLVAGGLAFATGTSWGTFGILIPVVLPVFASEPTLQIIGISACLAGAV